MGTLLALTGKHREDMVTWHELGHALSNTLYNAARKKFVERVMRKLNNEVH
jgi:DNA-binding GntR family transcriptional regulator